MTDSEHRRHPRLRHRAKIKVALPTSTSQIIADMRDFSESGLFLLCSEDLGLEKGSLLEVQTTEFEDAPIQTTRVVRIEPGVGIALEFIRSDSSADIQ